MIDFTRIKGDAVEGQRSFFEQLVCHLARLDGNSGEFRRVEGAGGDGGVEALRILPGGAKIGYQAKYYPFRKNINWSNLDESVETALTQHPELKRYVIALPCDFTGRRAARSGSTEGVWGKWDTQVKVWKKLAAARGMDIEFEPWTAFELEAALLRSGAQHLIRFFFDQQTFTREWMQRHLNRTMHDLQARYSPDEHVDTESLKTFDIIYRRENVRRDLRAVFDTANGSNTRAATALLKSPVVEEADLLAAEKALSNFLSLSEAIDWGLVKPWPVCEWLTSWYSLTRRLLAINDTIRAKNRNEKAANQDVLYDQVSEMTRVYKLVVDQVFGRHWSDLLSVDVSRAVLFVGRAGAGKSHVLARGAETAWNAGAPVIHILGQHVLDDDPRASILKRLEIANWSFHEALSALNLAAEATDTRAMLVIDALNEGRGTYVWRNHLASLIREVNEHDRIFLVLSCREEYLDYVIPKHIIANPRPYPGKEGLPPEDCAPLGKLVQVSVQGFRTEEEREKALQMFMDAKGIARPTAPVLDPEFFNPLFMSSVCRSMAKAGIKVFPRGLHGARDIFSFMLRTKAKVLGTRHDENERVPQALRAVLNSLAKIMVERRNDYVPLHDAINVIDSAFEAFPIGDQTWLEVLEGSDILRRDVEHVPNEISDWSSPNEVVRFSFQRLQDNLIAEHLLNEYQGIDIEDAFEAGAPFAFLVRRSIRNDGKALFKFNPRWVSVLGALWSAVAEKYEKELWDLRSFFGSQDIEYYPSEFQPVFHASIRERSGASFTPRTKQILDILWEDEQREKLAIILSTSCVPGHAWNAYFLAERLFSFSLADRNTVWSRWFIDNRSELFDRAMGVTDWALNVDTSTADAEVLRLAGITLACLISVENPNICERAKKSLVHLLTGTPTLLRDLENRFRPIDDPSIQECLLAAGSKISFST